MPSRSMRAPSSRTCATDCSREGRGGAALIVGYEDDPTVTAGRPLARADRREGLARRGRRGFRRHPGTRARARRHPCGGGPACRPGRALAPPVQAVAVRAHPRYANCPLNQRIGRRGRDHGREIKKIAFLVMTMALAVAMVACQAATPKTGDTGDTGATGPQGDPGTSDNSPPTASTIPNQYLVLDSEVKLTATAKPGASAAAGNYGSVEIDLSKYFTDAESLTLTYTATSSDKTIASLNTSATTNLITGGGSILTVTAKGVGTSTTATSAMATITVEAHDGVSDTVASTTFDVVVATSNTAPRVTLLEGIEDLIDRDAVDASTTDVTPAVPALYKKLYKADGTITRAFRTAIDPGSIGTEKETLSLRAVVGNNKAIDAVVSVTTPVAAGGNSYSISITALKPTVPVGPTGTKMVKIFAADSFGAETAVDTFEVEVNTPPSIIRDLPDIVLSRGGATDDPDEALGVDPNADAEAVSKYTLDKYFGFLELDTVTITADAENADDKLATLPADRGDTTCTYTTSPSQPTGRRARIGVAAIPGAPVEVKAIAADPVTATTMAAVHNGRVEATVTANVVQNADNELLRTALKNSKVSTDLAVITPAMVMVESDAFDPGANNNEPISTTELGINKDVPARGIGTFMLTITCEDPDARVSGSARITVQS